MSPARGPVSGQAYDITRQMLRNAQEDIITCVAWMKDWDFSDERLGSNHYRSIIELEMRGAKEWFLFIGGLTAPNFLNTR